MSRPARALAGAGAGQTNHRTCQSVGPSKVSREPADRQEDSAGPEIRQGRSSERRLAAELANCGDLTDAMLEALWRDFSLPADALLRAKVRHGRIAPAGRLFLFDPLGGDVLVIPVVGRLSALCNLVAHDPETDFWWCRVYQPGGWLGVETINAAQAIGGVVWLHTSLSSWLLSRGRGVFSLDRSP